MRYKGIYLIEETKCMFLKSRTFQSVLIRIKIMFDDGGRVKNETFIDEEIILSLECSLIKVKKIQNSIKLISSKSFSLKLHLIKSSRII